MSDYAVEVFRAEVESVTAKLVAVIEAELVGVAAVDRSVIVSAALANAAGHVDGCRYDFFGATGRLAAIADDWRRE